MLRFTLALVAFLYASNAPLSAGEPQGNALHFALTSNVVLAGSVGLSVPGTIEFWAKRENGANVVMYAGGAPNEWYVLANDENVALHTIGAGVYRGSATSASVVPLDQWTHIAIVLSATGDTTFFVDGSPVADSGVATHPAVSAVPLVIGNDNFAGINPWAGALDEVRVWNVARTQQEIQDNRVVALTGTETGLVSYHRFNQGAAGADNTGVTTAAATAGTDGTLSNFTLDGATSNWIAADWSSNRAPTIASAIPDQGATEDAVFTFTFAAGTFGDADAGDTLTYSAQVAGGGELPTWLSFDAATRTFAGTPANAQVGTLSVDVSADDGNDGTVTDTFDIVVGNTNDAPTLVIPTPDRVAVVSSSFTAVIAAGTFIDVDLGDSLAWSATLSDGAPLPAWLDFDAATRTFSGTPTAVGTVEVRVTVTDLTSATASDDFVIEVDRSGDGKPWIKARWDDARCGSGSGLALVLLAALAFGLGLGRRDERGWRR